MNAEAKSEPSSGAAAPLQAAAPSAPAAAGAPGPGEGHRRPRAGGKKLFMEPEAAAALPSVVDLGLSGLADASDPSRLGGEVGRTRLKCSRCGSSSLVWCARCLTAVTPPGTLPHVSLPVKLLVIHHHGEKLSKSTAVHARVLAPETSEMVHYPGDLPSLPTDGSVVLLAATPNAVDLASYTPEQLAKIRTVVAIDSTWNQASGVAREPALTALPAVRLAAARTLFWRFQTGKTDDHLSTIEAIYLFYRTYQTTLKGKYEGEYDNLLFLFMWQYELVQGVYAKGERQFTTRMRPNFIRGKQTRSQSDDADASDSEPAAKQPAPDTTAEEEATTTSGAAEAAEAAAAPPPAPSS